MDPFFSPWGPLTTFGTPLHLWRSLNSTLRTPQFHPKDPSTPLCVPLTPPWGSSTLNRGTPSSLPWEPLNSTLETPQLHPGDPSTPSWGHPYFALRTPQLPSRDPLIPPWGPLNSTLVAAYLRSVDHSNALCYAHSVGRSLTHSRAHGKEVHVYEMNGSISYNFNPQCPAA